MSDILRVYLDPAEIGRDGYPLAWHKPIGDPITNARLTDVAIKDMVREQAGHRCVRCRHPYLKGAHGNGEWSPCDSECCHDGPVRFPNGNDWDREAQWRILTVHHLNRVKHDCRWWNLTSLCQRCHLTIQGKVYLERPWGRPHSDWFKPYAAGFYASALLGEELTREETITRLDELLDLELRELPLF